MSANLVELLEEFRKNSEISAEEMATAVKVLVAMEGSKGKQRTRRGRKPKQEKVEGDQNQDENKSLFGKGSDGKDARTS